MFSQACVKNSVQTGGVSQDALEVGTRPWVNTPLWSDTPLGRHPLGQTPPGQTPTPGQTPPLVRHPQADIPLGRQPPQGRHLLPPRTDTHSPLPPTATAADGTHPTGIHSCLSMQLCFSYFGFASCYIR